jgi:hypothetical protein
VSVTIPTGDLTFVIGTGLLYSAARAVNPAMSLDEDGDGHFVDGHFGSHANLTIPAGSYFIRSDPDCKTTVS